MTGKQATIASTAGQLIIGNGNGVTNTSTGLTWTTASSLLSATNLTISGTTTTGILCATTLSATNIGIGTTNPTTSSIEIVRPVTTATDLINMRYDATNGLRINQAYVTANDVKQIFIQKNNHVDSNVLTIYQGNVGVGTTTPANGYKFTIGGGVKINGSVDAAGANVFSLGLITTGRWV